MALSDAIAEELHAALGVSVRRATAVSGGDINEAHALTLSDDRRVFVKSNMRAPADMFAREADGLAWLREPRVIRVPDVVAITPHCLVLELIEAAPRQSTFDEKLGRSLAALHRSGATSFGLEHDNYIGTLSQSNAKAGDWATFYRDQRLLPLIERGGFETRDRKVLGRLLERLPDLVGDAELPARLHGDLWGGNLHVDEHGAPCLIDPAVYGGDREIDLAMMRLFGGFGERVFAAYDEAYPPKSGAGERIKLYQLYPLLVHVNLFGGSYVAQALAAAKAYV